MYIIYTIDVNTLELKIHDSCESNPQRMLEKIALDFLIFEEGKRKAKILTEFDHTELEKGYFLYKNNDKIDVYFKSQEICPGWTGTSIVSDVKKIMFFAFTEFVMTSPGVTLKLEKIEIPKNKHHDEILRELKKNKAFLKRKDESQ